MTDYPLVPNKAAEHALRQELAYARTAAARTIGEWFDAYCDEVEYAVKSTMEENGDGHLVLDALAPRRASSKAIRAELEQRDLTFSDEMELEGGPLVQLDEHGVVARMEWPQGEWIRLFWPDGSKLEFRGHRALVVFAFIEFWKSRQQLYKHLTDPTSNKPKTRIIEPFTPEWNAYMKAKKADQAKGVEP